MSVAATLRELGLNEKEVVLYLSLLKHGKTSPTSLSRFTKINRATVYSVAKGLQTKGLIAEDLSGKTLFLTPLPLAQLHNLIEQPRRELKVKEQTVKDLIVELNKVVAEKQYPVPKIRFVQEDDMEKFLFDNLEKWERSTLETDGIWRGFQDHGFVEVFENWIHASWKTKEAKNLKAQILTNASAIELRLAKKYPQWQRNMRSMPGLNFTATIWVAGDYLVMILTREHPYYAVEIHDSVLSQNMREVFKNLWGTV